MSNSKTDTKVEKILDIEKCPACFSDNISFMSVNEMQLVVYAHCSNCGHDFVIDYREAMFPENDKKYIRKQQRKALQ